MQIWKSYRILHPPLGRSGAKSPQTYIERRQTSQTMQIRSKTLQNVPHLLKRPEWPELAGSGPNWPEHARTDPNRARIGPQWPQLVRIGLKWTQLDQNWLRRAQFGAAGCCAEGLRRACFEAGSPFFGFASRSAAFGLVRGGASSGVVAGLRGLGCPYYYYVMLCYVTGPAVDSK